MKTHRQSIWIWKSNLCSWGKDPTVIFMLCWSQIENFPGIFQNNRQFALKNIMENGLCAGWLYLSLFILTYNKEFPLSWTSFICLAERLGIWATNFSTHGIRCIFFIVKNIRIYCYSRRILTLASLQLIFNSWVNRSGYSLIQKSVST